MSFLSVQGGYVLEDTGEFRELSVNLEGWQAVIQDVLGDYYEGNMRERHRFVDTPEWGAVRDPLGNLRVEIFLA